MADGMGGHNAGEVASAMAIDVFSQELRACDKLGSSALHRAVERANGAVYEKSRSMEQAQRHGHDLYRASRFPSAGCISPMWATAAPI